MFFIQSNVDHGIIILNHVGVNSNIAWCHCGQKPDATMKVIFHIQDPIFLLLYVPQFSSTRMHLCFNCLFIFFFCTLLKKQKMFCYRHHVHPRVLISCESVCHSLSSSEIAWNMLWITVRWKRFFTEGWSRLMEKLGLMLPTLLDLWVIITLILWINHHCLCHHNH